MTDDRAEVPYATIAVTGTDASDFLQGQLTTDVRQLVDGAPPVLAAWCNPKGRVIALMRLRRDGDTYRLALPAGLAAAVHDGLKRFVFRAKAGFDVVDASPADLALDSDESMAKWRARQLGAGIAEISESNSESFTPHMLNLDLLGAVSFDKGCYTGQEVVARTHYRGASRRRLARLGLGGAAGTGDPVEADGRKVGDIVSVIGTEALAVLPRDAIDAGVAVNGVSARVLDYPEEPAA